MRKDFLKYEVWVNELRVLILSERMIDYLENENESSCLQRD